jgi:hypothetical protein
MHQPDRQERRQRLPSHDSSLTKISRELLLYPFTRKRRLEDWVPFLSIGKVDLGVDMAPSNRRDRGQSISESASVASSRGGLPSLKRGLWQKKNALWNFISINNYYEKTDIQDSKTVLGNFHQAVSADPGSAASGGRFIPPELTRNEPFLVTKVQSFPNSSASVNTAIKAA